MLTRKPGDKMKCEHCGSKGIIKKGKRKLASSYNQRYMCSNCGRKFSMEKGKFKHSIILFAVSLYNSGKSLKQTAEAVRKKYKISVSRMTISRWTKRFGSSFLRLRDRLSSKYESIPAVSSKNFFHSGLVYPFMLHEWKVREFCKHEDLKKYLLGLDTWINRYFSSGKRCSELKSVINVDVQEKKNFLCTAVEHALRTCKDLNERHAAVQKHLLCNDSCTLATEVPVWMIDKKLGAINGHIDLIQVRYGRIYVLDYKPDAASQDKEKTASQLFWYARALSFRAKIPLDQIHCAWFDSEVCVEFEPSKVKLKLK